jgi:DNA segregation ATPase FtsK/SpoIIIE, S-DNA-T family
MPRGADKTVESEPKRQTHEVVGIVLIALGLLLLIALMSHDKADSGFNVSTPNANPHNLVGPIGATLSVVMFNVFGAVGFLVPFGMFAAALGCFFERFAWLTRRWPWILGLLVSAMGMLSLFEIDWTVLQNIKTSLGAPSSGGIIGTSLKGGALMTVGKVGGIIVLATVYGISLLFLTNFHLRDWIHSITSREKIDPEATPEERELGRRRRELEKQAKDLEKQMQKSARKAKGAKDAEPEPDEAPSGLGADLQPVPEPTIRDHSIPLPRPAAVPIKKRSDEERSIGLEEGETIPAAEVRAAATGDQVLGRSDEDAPPWNPDDEGAMPMFDEDGEGDPSLRIVAGSPSKPRLPARKPKRITVAATPSIGNYELPTVDFLNFPDTTVQPGESKELLLANARLMQQTLAQFGIEVALGDITRGPTITRYELHPAPGVKLEKISALSNNIAAALKAERINILAPVPGKSSVGIEVANAVKTKVIMRDLLESDEWHKSKARLPIALGKDVYGHPVIADLADMPHMLVAGSTGSGKSVCINAIIASLLYRFAPDQLRFVMIDPKVVELQQYNALPHLVVPVVTDPKKVVLALRWVVNEMEKRYQIFAKVGVRNIKSFNDRPKTPPPPKVSEPELLLTANKEKVEISSEGFAVELDEEIVVPRDEDIVIPDKLSYIVVIIDELADLMLVAPADVEMAIARITQMARAAGIHCIVATQRPSVDVITGVIKANIPARIAFQVASKVDSRTILDQMGADKLLGKGDMLYLPPGSAKLTRIQGVLITDEELQHLVDHIARQGKPSYEMEIHKQLQKPSRDLDLDADGSGEDEELIDKCIQIIREEQKASTSLLQRRLGLGYGRAARIMDQLEDMGIIGPSNGAKARDVLIDLDGEGHDGGGRHIV